MLTEALARASGKRVTLLRIAWLLTVALYLPTFRFQFVYDDLPQIVYNQRLHGWRWLPEYFTASFFGMSDVVNQYRPLVLLWYWLNYLVFELSPIGWHLSTVLVHLAAVGLVYKVMRRVTPSEDIAGLTALLFAIHPIHIETGAWIAGVSESLYACAALSAVYFYLGYLLSPMKDRQRRDLFFAAISFGAALLVKETALSVLAVLAGCDWLFAPQATESEPVYRRLRAALPRMLPFFVIGGLYLLARSYALRSFTHFPQPHTWTDVLKTVPAALWFYAKLLLWPFGMHSQFYDVGFVSVVSWSTFWGPLLGVLAVLAAALYWAKRSRLGAFAGLWLVVVLPPLAGMYGFRDHDLVHDRYLYLPVLSVCILLAAGWDYWERRTAKSGAARAWTVLALVMVTVFFSQRVWREEMIYRDDISLYGQGTKMAPNKAVLWDFLGFAYAREGRRPDAIAAHQRALALGSRGWETHGYLGDLYFESGDLEAAAAQLQEAAELRSGAGRAESLHKLGLTLLRLQRYAEAEAVFREAMALAPARVGDHFALGQALRHQAKIAEAVAEFKAEVALNNSEQAKRALADVATQTAHRP